MIIAEMQLHYVHLSNSSLTMVFFSSYYYDKLNLQNIYKNAELELCKILNFAVETN